MYTEMKVAKNAVRGRSIHASIFGNTYTLLSIEIIDVYVIGRERH